MNQLDGMSPRAIEGLVADANDRAACVNRSVSFLQAVASEVVVGLERHAGSDRDRPGTVPPRRCSRIHLQRRAGSLSKLPEWRRAKTAESARQLVLHSTT
jgi:hypothetical protein